MEIKGYKTPEECFAAYFGLESAEELSEAESFGGLSSEGEEVILSDKDIFDGIRQQGVWGWVDDSDVIHYWRSTNVDNNVVMHFIGHEIGHRTGEQLEDPIAEEERAEEFGFAAAKAFELLSKMIPV